MKKSIVLLLHILIFSLNGFCQTKKIELYIYSSDSIKINNSSISIEYKQGGDIVELATGDTSNHLLYSFDCTKPYSIIVRCVGYYTTKTILDAPCNNSGKLIIILEKMINVGNNRQKEE